jgi:predicted enzyme related to lactoylglutathione lyase
VGALVIFTPDVARLVRFYQQVLGLRPSAEASGDVRLVSADVEVLVHTVSRQRARATHESSPPEPRDDVALKPVFDVASLHDALTATSAAGGVVTNRAFTLDGLARHDVLDPDGNVLQLRAPAS